MAQESASAGAVYTAAPPQQCGYNKRVMLSPAPTAPRRRIALPLHSDHPQPIEQIEQSDHTGDVRDTRNRPLHDLRISLTDRCNFRCTYCMPRAVFGSDYAFLAQHELLTFDEIVRLATIAADLGVRKVRLTGGEPLLRRGIADLVRSLSAVPGIDDLTLTTNGSLLARHADDLKAAGLHRVTVSLDALDETTFRAMNDVDFPAATVLEGIAHARTAGLGPVKINMVVRRGVNEHEIVPMARHFRATGDIVRFIEYMDVGTTNGWRTEEVVSADEIRQILADGGFPVEPLTPNYPGEVAERFRFADGGGEVGIIASVTRPFCGDCSRTRLSADGRLYTCLFGADGYDLREPLRSGASDDALAARLRGIWRRRTDRYSEIRGEQTAGLRRVEMSHIGG